MTSNIFVTGGAGYIGSHVCKQLSKEGYCPVTFDNLSRGNRNAVKWGPLEIGHLDDTQKIINLFQKYNPMAVVHLAAYAYVGESVERPDLYYRNNVVGTLSLLDAMKSVALKKIVFSSSCAVYGNPKNIPIDEEYSRQPENPYGETKFMVEQILEDYCRSFELESVSLRYFNAAGADPEADIGEDHDPEPHLIPRAIKAALGEIEKIEIFGSDYDTRDGTAVRDYIHVSDLAVGHLASINYLLDNGSTTALNLGNERGYSVREILACVESVTGNKVPIKEASRRQGDPAELIANSSKARNLIAWNPQLSDIETIISTAVKWQQRTSK
jgi:UDP-arabinose 4-epimerase